MALLEVDGLTYTYPGGREPALADVSLRVEEGEFLALVGPNGAGKSTLLLALAGMIPHLFHGELRGRVTVAGRDTRVCEPGDLAGLIGLVLQNPANQLSGMRWTVFEETAFGLENLGVPRSEMPARVERALDQVGLSGLKDRSPYQLSGGEQQRLALASILAMEPRVLLLDEPTALLDPAGADAIFGLLRGLSKAGTTIVAAGHDLERLANTAGRILALSHGRVVLTGTPREVLASLLLEEIGVGRTRFSRAAERAREKGLWPADEPLPVTLEETAASFMQRERDEHRG